MPNRIEEVSIPFEGKLGHEVTIGSFIKIFGKTAKNSERFAINLTTDSQDIAFHFNVRLKDCLIVSNSRIGSDWSNEEKDKKMTFEKNQTFTLIISVEKEVLRLFLNGTYLLDFKHRLPFNDITGIAIDGELEVFWIECDFIEYDHKWDDISHQLTITSTGLLIFYCRS